MKTTENRKKLFSPTHIHYTAIELKGALIKLKNAEGAIITALSAISKAKMQLNHVSKADGGVTSSPMSGSLPPFPLSPGATASAPPSGSSKTWLVELTDSISSKGTFWCRPFANDGYNKVISTVVTKLRNDFDILSLSSKPSPEEVVEGSFWACRPTVNEPLPRRVMIEKCISNMSPRYIVRAIDVGDLTEVNITDLSPLANELASMPPMAFCCSLHGLPIQKFPYEAKWRFRDLTWQRVLRLDMCGFAEQDNGQPLHLVDLLTTGPTALHVNAEIVKTIQEASKEKMVSPRAAAMSQEPKLNDANENHSNDPGVSNSVAKIDASYASVEPFIPASSLGNRASVEPPITVAQLHATSSSNDHFGSTQIDPGAYSQGGFAPAPVIPHPAMDRAMGANRDTSYMNRMQEVRLLKETVDKGSGTFFLLVASYHKLMHTYNDGRLFVDQTIGQSLSLAHQLRGASSVYILFVKTGKQETRLCAVAQVTSIMQQKNPRKDTQAHLRFLCVSKVSYEWNEPFANGQEIPRADAHRLLLSLCNEIQMEKSRSLFDSPRMPMPVKDPFVRDAMWKDAGDLPGYGVPPNDTELGGQLSRLDAGMPPMTPTTAQEWSTTALGHLTLQQQQRRLSSQMDNERAQYVSFSEPSAFFEEGVVELGSSSGLQGQQPGHRVTQGSKYFDVHGNRIQMSPPNSESEALPYNGTYMDAKKQDEIAGALPRQRLWSTNTENALTSDAEGAFNQPAGDASQLADKSSFVQPKDDESEGELDFTSQFQALFDDSEEWEGHAK